MGVSKIYWPHVSNDLAILLYRRIKTSRQTLLLAWCLNLQIYDLHRPAKKNFFCRCELLILYITNNQTNALQSFYQGFNVTMYELFF